MSTVFIIVNQPPSLLFLEKVLYLYTEHIATIIYTVIFLIISLDTITEAGEESVI